MLQWLLLPSKKLQPLMAAVAIEKTAASNVMKEKA
jgi:hypothetical protein